MSRSEQNPRTTRYNLASITASVFTVVAYAVIYSHASGRGPSILGDVVALFIVTGIGLALAFILAMAAMMRGEEPIWITLVAFGVPPAFVAFLIFNR